MIYKLTLSLIGILLVVILMGMTSCEKERCKLECLVITGVMSLDEDCNCQCTTPRQTLISGPEWNYCAPSTGNYLYGLKSEEYGILDCDEIEIIFLNVRYEFEPFTGFLTPPYSSEDFKEEAIRFYIVISTGGRNFPDHIDCFAVTQNGGDRSELLIYTFPGSIGIGVNSEEEARPVYLANCEDELLPARVKGYFDEDLISLHFFFYTDEEAYFSNPDQYLYSEILNFERQYSRHDLGE
jgi:hypothetical protein